MKKAVILFCIYLCISITMLSQSIAVTSFNANPVEVNPLIGGSLTTNFEYTSEAGSSGNHIYGKNKIRCRYDYQTIDY